MSEKENHIPLEGAAAEAKLSPQDVILRAASGEIALAVNADGWVVAPTKDRKATGDTILLEDAWLYLRPGFARRFLKAEKSDTHETRLYRSKPDGPTDRIYLSTPKPRLKLIDLYVPASHVSKLVEAGVKKRKAKAHPDGFSQELQDKAAKEAASYWYNNHRHPTLTQVAIRIKIGYPDEERSVETIVRLIRNTWDPKYKNR